MGRSLCQAVFLALAQVAASSALSASDAVAQSPLEAVVVETADGDRYTFRVEIADNIYSIMRGLTFREELASDEGMLFVFSERAERRFWMKDTLIPLDLLFLSDDGRIEHIHHDAPPDDRTDIPSTVPVSRVLEINGGLARELGIAIGDVVSNETYFTARGSAGLPSTADLETQ